MVSDAGDDDDDDDVDVDDGDDDGDDWVRVVDAVVSCVGVEIYEICL